MSSNQASIQRNFKLNRTNRETSTEHAQRVFNELLSEVKSGKKIALIYPTNKEEVKLFTKYYNKKNATLYTPKNQNTTEAKFFQEFIKLVNHEAEYRIDLSFGDIKILPIATSLTSQENHQNNAVTKESLDEDLSQIENALKAGYTVYGFTNSKDYKLGTKASTHIYNTSNPLFTIDGDCQNYYIQRKLAKLEIEYGTNNSLDDNKEDEIYSPQHLDNPLNEHRNQLVNIVRQYCNHNEKSKGFFHHHGSDGQRRALDFLRKVLTELDGLDDLDGFNRLVIDFLSNSRNGNTHPHSFRTILMKELFLPELHLKEVSGNFEQYLIEIESEYIGNGHGFYELTEVC